MFFLIVDALLSLSGFVLKFQYLLSPYLLFLSQNFEAPGTRRALHFAISFNVCCELVPFVEVSERGYVLLSCSVFCVLIISVTVSSNVFGTMTR